MAAQPAPRKLPVWHHLRLSTEKDHNVKNGTIYDIVSIDSEFLHFALVAATADCLPIGALHPVGADAWSHFVDPKRTIHPFHWLDLGFNGMVSALGPVNSTFRNPRMDQCISEAYASAAKDYFLHEANGRTRAIWGMAGTMAALMPMVAAYGVGKALYVAGKHLEAKAREFAASLRPEGAEIDEAQPLLQGEAQPRAERTMPADVPSAGNIVAYSLMSAMGGAAAGAASLGPATQLQWTEAATCVASATAGAFLAPVAVASLARLAGDRSAFSNARCSLMLPGALAEQLLSGREP